MTQIDQTTLSTAQEASLADE